MSIMHENNCTLLQPVWNLASQTSAPSVPWGIQTQHFSSLIGTEDGLFPPLLQKPFAFLKT